VDWYPFEHPQLGPVEIGGWNKFACFRNPPKKYLEREVKRFPGWLTWQALTTPKLELLRTEVVRLGEDAWKVRLVVHNTGYLPTYVSRRALERKITRGVVYEIELGEGARLASGKARVEGTQLEGRANKVSLQSFTPEAAVTGDRGQCEWTVRGPRGSAVTLIARHDRAGRVAAKVELA
jgi:hypothetical protein